MEMKQLQAVAVLNVELDEIRFTVLSTADGRVISSSTEKLKLITDVKPRTNDTDDAGASNVLDSSQKRVPTAPCDPDTEPPSTGRVEQDPKSMWDAVERTIRDAINQMNRCGVSPKCIITMAVVTEPATVLAWDKETGQTLHNAVHWTDERVSLAGIRTAAALDWITKNSLAVRAAGARCLFGTLDAWVMWRLTASDVFTTEPTNASYTGLMDLNIMEWDKEACAACGVPLSQWPTIQWPHTEERFVVAQTTMITGLTVSVVVARPSSALYARDGNQPGRVAMTIGERTMFVLAACGTRSLPVKSDAKVPLTVIAYVNFERQANSSKTRPKVFYGQLGVSEVTATVCWLINTTEMVSSTADCMKAYSYERTSDPSVYAVTAVNVPHNRPDACVVFSGIEDATTTNHMIAAAIDSVSHVAADLLHLCVPPGAGPVTVFTDGPYSVFDNVTQRLADVYGCQVVSDQLDAVVYGAARMAAFRLNVMFADVKTAVMATTKPKNLVIDHQPTTTAEQRAAYRRLWLTALQCNYGWAEDEEGDKLAPKDNMVGRAQLYQSTLFTYVQRLWNRMVRWSQRN